MFEDSRQHFSIPDVSVTEPLPAQTNRSGPVDVSLFRLRGRRAIKAVVLAIALVVLGIVGESLGLRYRLALMLIFLGASVMAAFACVQAARALLVVRQVKPMPLGFASVVALFPMLGGLFMAAVGALAAFFTTVQFTRGRQLRAFGRVLLPPVRPGTGWHQSTRGRQLRAFGRVLLPPVRPGTGWLSPLARTIDIPGDARGVAEAWRENGRTEHASVAAFAKLTMDLVALGAPEALLRVAQEDAHDEIRHARACFSLARDMDGMDQSPGPFPQPRGFSFGTRFRSIRLARLAVESLIDGALHEGLSAAVISKLATQTTVPVIASTLRGLAADEGRHAAHGWDVVEWCLQEGGGGVAAALRGAMLALPEEIPPENEPAAAASGEWQRFGIAGRRLKQGEYAKAQAALARRLGALLDTAAQG